MIKKITFIHYKQHLTYYVLIINSSLLQCNTLFNEV